MLIEQLLLLLLLLVLLLVLVLLSVSVLLVLQLFRRPVVDVDDDLSVILIFLYAIMEDRLLAMAFSGR
jgi:hypothetical protein